MAEDRFAGATWRTAQDIFQAQPGQPLTENINHSDFEQSRVGNCWLMAAISTVAEYAAEKGDDNADVANLFLTKHYHPGQPVQIQLFHVNTKQLSASTLEPVVYTVQDSFLMGPDGKGHSVQPREPEDAWVLFLEAAVAMMISNKQAIDIDCYKELDKGGYAHWGLMALTGTRHVDLIRCKEGTDEWRVDDIWGGQSRAVSADDIWAMVHAAEEAAELVCCGVDDKDGDGQRSDVNGVTEGHAYSIKEVGCCTRTAYSGGSAKILTAATARQTR